MQGSILIVDGVSTNRIMLKVQLSAAWYHVVQADRFDGTAELARRVRPDVILSAMSMPGGDALTLRAQLNRDPHLASVPMIALTRQNDRAARLRALAAGIDDVLSYPLDDMVLLARVRSLIRANAGTRELEVSGHGDSGLGFAEPQAGFARTRRRARIAIVTRTPGLGAIWRARLHAQTRHQLDLYRAGDMQELLLSGAGPDAVVVELDSAGDGPPLLADLRARGATRNAAVIAVPNPASPLLAADALDRGADDVLANGFCADELTLRLETQLRRKARSDRLRASMRDGLRAAVTDPMTGLHNRRFALPELNRIARQPDHAGRRFAVMLADLDHFKRINDRYGHAAGDAVLVETARRLSDQMRPGDLIARVGGEEFLMALPATSPDEAGALAARLCRRIDCEPFVLPGRKSPVTVTTSIGLVIATCGGPGSASAAELIDRADRALYQAKHAGRNRVSLGPAAA